jgi:hypothetical protein
MRSSAVSNSRASYSYHRVQVFREALIPINILGAYDLQLGIHLGLEQC